MVSPLCNCSLTEFSTIFGALFINSMKLLVFMASIRVLAVLFPRANASFWRFNRVSSICCFFFIFCWFGFWVVCVGIHRGFKPRCSLISCFAADTHVCLWRETCLIFFFHSSHIIPLVDSSLCFRLGLRWGGCVPTSYGNPGLLVLLYLFLTANTPPGRLRTAFLLCYPFFSFLFHNSHRSCIPGHCGMCIVFSSVHFRSNS